MKRLDKKTIKEIRKKEREMAAEAATTRKYILEGETPVPIDNLEEWAKWFENVKNRTLRKTALKKTWISTVFLGLDHNYTGTGDPILFETRVFENELKWSTLPNSNHKYPYNESLEQERYSTHEAALNGHEKLVEKYTEKESNEPERQPQSKIQEI